MQKKKKKKKKKNLCGKSHSCSFSHSLPLLGAHKKNKTKQKKTTERLCLTKQGKNKITKATHWLITTSF